MRDRPVLLLLLGELGLDLERLERRLRRGGANRRSYRSEGELSVAAGTACDTARLSQQAAALGLVSASRLGKKPAQAVRALLASPLEPA